MKTIALRVRMIAAVGVAAILGGGCEDPDDSLLSATEFEPVMAVAAGTTMEAASPQQQNGLPGERAAYDPTVRVLGSDGTPVQGIVVRFAVTEGGGSVSQMRVRTNAEGYATTVWTLGAAGRNTVRATVRRVTSIRFVATVGTATPVADVEVSPGTTTLEAVAQTYQLTAYSLDPSGNVVPDRYTWRSTNTGVATVDSTGLVRSIGNGIVAVIALSATGHADTAQVTVAQRVASVSVAPQADTVAVGGTIQLTATPRDANGVVVSGTPVTWASSSPTIATVTTSGVVTGRVAGSATITATVDGQTGSAAVLVSSSAPPTGGPVFLFRSDWSTALGQTDAALRDLAQPLPWSRRIGNGRGNEVVSASGLGFPTTNALRVVAEDSDGDGDASSNIVRVENLPIPAVGEARYYRWYMRVTVPNQFTGDPETHPIQDGLAISDTNWAFQVITRSDGTWLPSLETDGGAAWPNTHWGRPGIVLQKGVTYRFEVGVLRTATDRFQLSARIYAADGRLLYDNDDFLNADGSGSLADNPVLLLRRPDSLASLNAGFNGLGGPSTLMPFTMYYQAGVAICRETWCGPY